MTDPEPLPVWQIALERLQTSLPEGGNPGVEWLDAHVDDIRVFAEATSWANVRTVLGSQPGTLYAWANRAGLRAPTRHFKHKEKKKRTTAPREKALEEPKAVTRKQGLSTPFLDAHREAVVEMLEEKSQPLVAHELGVSDTALGRWMRQRGIPSPRAPGQHAASNLAGSGDGREPASFYRGKVEGLESALRLVFSHGFQKE